MTQQVTTLCREPAVFTLPVLMTAACGVALMAGSATAQYGPPDRTAVTRFMSRSSMVMTDLNGDSAVSDVDLAMSFLDRMVELYGTDLIVGDLDEDGVETYQDFVSAVGLLMKSAFGKTAIDGQEIVGPTDLQQTVIAVSSGTIAGDLNLDGAVDTADLYVTVDRFGEEVNDFDIEQAAQLAAEYIGAIQTYGRDGFMSSVPAPSTHLPAVSDTWPPNHPGWWQPNHLWSISAGYEGEPPTGEHDTHASSITPTESHNYAISEQWPANHFWYASHTWLPPRSGHQIFVSYDPDEVYHHTEVSKSWPAGHTEYASSTRPLPPEHESTVSRIWWPNHTYEDSMGRIMPPHHWTEFTDSWVHEIGNSQNAWPPNHTIHVSNGWGPAHSHGTSLSYPPGHLLFATQTWPGPQSGWPPGHLFVVSESWGEPDSGGWPIFPPDHSWWTTFQDITNWIPRLPWGGAE